ncbi:MAG: phage/plasmid primase, P4 family [Lachnospiraceae bacterium]|nr:phage/plasmid primase, P4 family [Lachnospiraceae bacterium]MCM1227673.1 phage/plasmid primase, P4 family [Clostridium sp.]
MKPQYIKFSGKHPEATKEKRQYTDRPHNNWNSYGASYSPAFFKLDIDDFKKLGEIEEPIHGKPRSDTIVAILDFLKICYNGIKTEHGKQLFFRVPEWLEQKNKINWYCPLGIKCEWKFPARDDHIPLMINGVEREFFKGSIDNEDIDELPPFLYPLQGYKNKPFMLDFSEGDRTQKLGAYVFYLVKKGYTADRVFQIVRLMNEYIFEKPIPKSTLKAEILNESTLKKLQDQEKEKADKNISHSDLAKEIIDRFDLITVNGDFYSYENGVYKPFPNRKITHYLTEHYPKLNANFEREVIRHISGLTYTEPPKDDGTVNVKNGVLSFSTDGTVVLLPHRKEHISFKQFNATYNPEAQNKLLDDTLLLWFNGSSKQIELFNQLLGYLLMNHVNYQKVFFFVGAPSTGKTTLLKLVICFCGKENVSAIQLEDMGKPFGLASIVNKIANVFSDIRKTRVLASETFKMLADGSPLQISRKFREELTYCFTGKLLFGMNSYPDFSKDFGGIERRVVIFEFRHIFKKGDPDFNPAILESLTSDECMSALLNKAISGYKSLIDNKGFITTKESERALADFVSDNDNVVKWLHEAEIEEDYLLREPIKMGYKGLYPEYQAFCINAGEEAKAQKDFSRTICNMYGFKTHTKRIGGERPQMFVKK